LAGVFDHEGIGSRFFDFLTLSGIILRYPLSFAVMGSLKALPPNERSTAFSPPAEGRASWSGMSETALVGACSVEIRLIKTRVDFSNQSKKPHSGFRRNDEDLNRAISL
jgi:hypothetical protein